MRVILLGTAAGGGFPQWNCACPLCVRAGGDEVPARSQDGVAVSADGRAWYLLNASPDLRSQILSTPALRAGPGPRDTPVRGVLLTDAELDHTLGLLSLREAADLTVWAPRPVLDAVSDPLPLREVIGRYHGWNWVTVSAEDKIGPVDPDGLVVTVIPVSGKRPRYAADSPVGDDWVVAYRVHDPATGGTLVYAPCLAHWPADLDASVADADVVLLDGTFYTADELLGSTGREAAPGPGARTPMGHLPIAGEDGSLARIRALRGPRWIYTHLNNTNPLLDAASPFHEELAASGAEVLPDGVELTL